MRGVIIGGIALMIPLLLCLVIKSPIMMAATAIACIFYGAAVLGVVIYTSLEFWRTSRELNETIREIRYLLKL